MDKEIIDNIDYYYNNSKKFAGSNNFDLVNFVVMGFTNKRNLTGEDLRRYFNRTLINAYINKDSLYHKQYKDPVTIDRNLGDDEQKIDNLFNSFNVEDITHLDIFQALEDLRLEEYDVDRFIVYYTSTQKKEDIIAQANMSRKGYYYKYIKPIKDLILDRYDLY